MHHSGSLVFASSNSHKVQEVDSLLGHRWRIKGLHDLNIYEEIEENGQSFRENAKIKAQYVFDKCGMDVFADDSGLEVESLNWAPGIFSARYSGNRDMKRNLEKVLKDLGSNIHRTARFTCCICLIYRGYISYFEGQIEGDILFQPQGEGGFGYDPIFKPRGYSESFAQLGQDLKNTISHRGLAIQKMKDFLDSISSV